MLERLLPGGLALAMLASACVGDDTVANGPDSTLLSSDEISLTSGLQTAASCDALLERLIEVGLEEVGPYGFGQNQYFGGRNLLEMGVETMAIDGADTSGSAASPTAQGEMKSDEFSGTNNQEVGVDEPDIVKTDGERIIVASGNVLRVIDVGPDGPTSEKTIKLGENLWANEILLNGDTVLVMSNSWTDVPLQKPALDSSSVFYPGGVSTTLISEVNLATGQIERTFEFEGGYLSARQIDGTARIVLSAVTGQFPFVYPSNDAAKDSAEKANRDLVASSTIEQWLPTYRILDSEGEVTDSGPIVECDRMHLPQDFSGFGSLAVLTIDLDQGLELIDSLAVLTDGQTIYASTDRLAVATARWPEWDDVTGEVVESSDVFTTAIHTFDISDPTTTSYRASGSVRGHLLDQFSMSEYDGALRVATTEGAPWFNSEPGQSESFVTVLGEDEGALVELGQVGGLGKGEQIFAVRFMGPTAYVVTFEQVDPLYTIDLSDPAAPTLLGELKIPGFSTYLHPVADGRLIGIGQDATDDGRTTGAQVSSFDVSDLTNPTRTATLDMGDNTSSAVDWDKKAFTWWDSANTAFVPISWWNYDHQTGSEDNGAALVVVTVGPDGSLTEAGRISHPALRNCETSRGYSEELIEPDSSTIGSTTAESRGTAATLVESEPVPDSELTPPEDAPGPPDADIAKPAPSDEPAPVDGMQAPPEDEPSAPSIEPAPPQIEPAPPVDEEYCWTQVSEIRRTIVVGDNVYTLSDTSLQANRLADLSLVGRVDFEN